MTSSKQPSELGRGEIEGKEDVVGRGKSMSEGPQTRGGTLQILAYLTLFLEAFLDLFHLIWVFFLCTPMCAIL